MNEINDEITFDTNFGQRKENAIIKVIGVGGAGNNAVQHMYKEGIVGVDFMVCNTDRMAVEHNEVPLKLVFGDSGLGAGADPQKAAALAEESEQAIRELIGEETRMLFITAGMGKGTGTGASPVVARIAHDMNILTIGVVTYPYELEGDRSFKKADAGIEELKKYVDSLIIIQNQKIMEQYENETLRTALGYADDVLKNAVKCIAELITLDGYQNVDFNDVLTIMKDSGEAMLGLAEASGEDRIEKVVSQALTCPLIDDANIVNAQNFLFFVSYGEGRELTVGELGRLSKEFKSYQDKDTNVIWGHAVDKSLGDKVKLSVIVTNYSKSRGEEFDPISGGHVPHIESKYKSSTPAVSEDMPFDPMTAPQSEAMETPIQEVPAAPQAQQYVQPADSTQQQYQTPVNNTSYQQPSTQQPYAQPQQPQDHYTAPTNEPIRPGEYAKAIQVINSGNDARYDDDQNFKALTQTPAYQQQPTMAMHRVEQIVHPTQGIPQASYADSLLFGITPNVD